MHRIESPEDEGPQGSTPSRAGLSVAVGAGDWVTIAEV